LGRPAVVCPPAGEAGLGAPLSGRWGREGGGPGVGPGGRLPSRWAGGTGGSEVRALSFESAGLDEAGSESLPDVGCW
jgi:hypothetical protein